jgi:hypothetical protein
MVGTGDDPSLTAQATEAGQLEMIQIFLIGIAAGAAAALLFASVASGSVISILLFYLAPLPILIAAVGWSHLAGLVAALIAGGALAFVFGGLFFVAFLIGIGLPAWWLGYLALLARPGTAAGAATLEWYPVGSLVVWAAILGSLIVAVVIFNFGFDAESFRAGLRRAFEQILRVQTQAPEGAPLALPGLSDANRLLDVMVMIVPPTAAVLATVTNLINLWLAGRIVKVSGRLQRPWPDLPAMEFPGYAPILLAVGLVAAFAHLAAGALLAVLARLGPDTISALPAQQSLAPGLVGIVGGVFAASLLMAYGVLGFAVLHMITRRLKGRGFLLAGTYAAVVVFGWPVLAMTALGLVDSALDIRGRIARRGAPPTRPTSRP